jgi:hypothetical protein
MINSRESLCLEILKQITLFQPKKLKQIVVQEIGIELT